MDNITHDTIVEAVNALNLVVEAIDEAPDMMKELYEISCGEGVDDEYLQERRRRSMAAVNELSDLH